VGGDKKPQTKTLQACEKAHVYGKKPPSREALSQGGERGHERTSKKAQRDRGGETKGEPRTNA